MLTMSVAKSIRRTLVTAQYLAAISVFACAMAAPASGADAVTVVDRDALSSRELLTWEGPYSFSREEVVSIEGFKDLSILIYERRGKAGELVDFARTNTAGQLLLLREADTTLKGVTPILEGVEVFPGTNQAEIIVRWLHQGNGGHRTIEKYRYTPDRLELLDKSHFRGRSFGLKWVSDSSLVAAARASTNTRPYRATADASP